MCDVCVAFANYQQNLVYADAYNTLAVGINSMPRLGVSSNVVATGNGNLRLAFFTATKTFLSTQARTWSGGTAAVTPTSCKWGLYLVSTAANGDVSGPLIAATADDPTLFAATNTPYLRPWITPIQIVAGQRLAWGALVVGSAVSPSMQGQTFTHGDLPLAVPRINGSMTGLADLPANLVIVAASGSSARPYAEILP